MTHESKSFGTLALVFRPLVLALPAVLSLGLTASAQQITDRTATPLSPTGPRRAITKGDKPLGCEGLRNGIISEPGLTAGFTFQGAMGDVVDLVLVETLGFAGSFPIATLSSPTEGELGVLNGTTLRTFVLPETGQYSVSVTATAAGSFKVGRWCWPPVVAGNFLDCGAVLSDGLDVPGELDFFVFTGQLGDDVQLSLIETGGFAGSTPRGTLFSPTGAPLLSFDADNVVELSLPETGSYTLRVQANDLLGTGSYNVGRTCFPPLNPILLSCGAPPMPLTIDDPGEVRFFTFDGGVDDVIEITLAGGGNAVPTMRVFDPLGSLVGSFTSDSLTAIRLGGTGSYTIEVKASTLAETGPFSIALACRAPLGPATAIACGGAAAGTLLSVGEFDFYTFTGTAGDTAELTLSATAGFPGSSAPRMRVFTPSGVSLGAFEGDTVNPLALPETGTYTVRVTSNTLVDTGTYNLSLACLPPSGSTHLGDDSLFPGDIGAPGEVDLFTFEGEMGEVVEIPLVVTSGFVGTVCRGTLRAPSSTVVGTFDANSLTDFTLPETGTFTFEIIAVNLISTGAYRTGMERRKNPGNDQDEDPESPTLVCGQIVSGSIDQAGEVDYIRFEGTAGDVVELTLVATAGWPGSVPAGTLFAPSDTNLGSFIGNTLNPFTLPETGEYSVRVIANTLVNTGTYNLGLSCRDPVGPVVANLVCDDIVSSSISQPAEVEYFTFNGQTGDIVEIALVATAGFPGSTPSAVVFTPSGAVLDSFFGNSLNGNTLPETGQYAIRVTTNTLFHAGDYNIGLSCRVPVEPVVANLTCGNIVSASIDVPAEVDYFTFDGEMGDIVEIALVATAGWPGSVPAAAVFTPSGALLDSFFANALRGNTLPETGQYTVRVIANTLFHAGDYNIGLSCRVPVGPVVDNLTCGEVFSSSIDVPAEVDYFTFDGQANDIVEIALVATAGWPGSVPAAAVFTPSGVLLDSFFGNTLNGNTLPETGQYTIRVIANTLVHSGDYNIGLSCRVPVGPVVDNLTCGEVFSSSIDIPAEIDYFTFDGQAGDIVEIALVATAGWPGSVPAAAVFTPSGAFVTSFFGNSLNGITLTETGQYTIRVGANTLFHSGSYNIGLSCRVPVGPVVADLGCGDLVSSSITQAAEVDYFTFDGTASDFVEISLVATGGFPGSTAAAAVFTPSGALLDSFFANSLNGNTLPETGQYTIRIIANTLVNIGDYSVGLNCP